MGSWIENKWADNQLFFIGNIYYILLGKIIGNMVVKIENMRFHYHTKSKKWYWKMKIWDFTTIQSQKNGIEKWKYEISLPKLLKKMVLKNGKYEISLP